MRQERPPFGDPPPKYPATVKAVRRFGALVTGDDMIGTPIGLGFDVLVRTITGDMEIQDVGSSLPPPPNNVDVNPTELVGRAFDAWYIPEEDLFMFFIPLPADNIDCASIGG